jgi:O-antigen/teichoic acid export membrane protein
MSNVWSVLVDFGLAVVLIPLIDVWGAVVAGGAAQGLSMTFQVRAELKSQEMSVKEFIGANSMWVWGVACGGLAVLLGEVARTRIGVPLAVAIAIGVGTLSTSVIARATGGALRGNDLEAFVGSMPPRLRRTMRLLLRAWCPKAGGTAG